MGAEAIEFGLSQPRSGTGPADFASFWSTDGVNFASVFQYSLEAIIWSSVILNPASVDAPTALASTGVYCCVLVSGSSIRNLQARLPQCASQAPSGEIV
ncbi:MAG: hypothetical protein KF724_11555 [Phycisphaeraceae bacterium]|nr:hypothetical protein [Phycisphaeraceae bacterium]